MCYSLNIISKRPHAVSYTHLDVYKRQELLITDPNRDDFWLNDFIMNEGFSLEWAIQEVSPETRPLINQYEREKAKKVFNDENHHDFLKIILKDWIYPVSYTHLDVYKRQSQGRKV